MDGLAFGWRSAILLAALAPLIPLIFALATTLANRRANRTLAALLLVLAGIATPWMIGFAGFYGKWQVLSFVPFALPLAVMPLLCSLGGAKGLVIDVRGNEGGLSCGDPILARLSGDDLVLDQYAPRVRFKRSPPQMDQYFDTPAEEFRYLGMQGIPVGDGCYGYPPERPADVIEAQGPKLSLPTAVLTDAANSSATHIFAERIKRFGLAKLIGQETGGNLRGINGGAIFFVRLPDSGIEFDLPLIGYYPSTPQPDRGVLPAIAARSNARDIAEGRDREFKTAVAWIAGC